MWKLLFGWNEAIKPEWANNKLEGKNWSVMQNFLKGQCHEIYESRFFASGFVINMRSIFACGFIFVEKFAFAFVTDKISSWISPKNRSYIRKYFSMEIRGPDGLVRKSRDTVPLKRQYRNMFNLLFLSLSSPSGPVDNGIKKNWNCFRFYL